MGTRKSLFSHLLETPWQQSSLVIAFERTHPPGLGDWKTLYNKRALAGPSAYTAHQQLLHNGCHPIPPAGALPWVCPAAGPLLACCYHQALDIPAGGPEPGVEAERGRKQYWEEEGRAPSGSFFVPFGLMSSSSLPSLCPCACTFGNTTGLLPKLVRTAESAIPARMGCASPSLSIGSEQPWWLSVLSASAPWKQNPGSPGFFHWESQQRFFFSPSSPCCCSLVIKHDKYLLLSEKSDIL